MLRHRCRQIHSASIQVTAQRIWAPPPPLPAEDYVPGVICFHAKFGTGLIERAAVRAGLVEVLFGEQRRVLDLEVCRAGQMLRVGSRGPAEK